MNQTTEYQEYPKENREHKSTLFCKVFEKSFLIDCNMNLYEQQSTFNPNMPLRGLLYFAQLYNKYIAKHNVNLYSSVVQKIPVPKYIVFYNGTKEQPGIFVAKVREYATADIENRESAIIRAIDECIEAGILADILIEQKAEVLELMLTTFNKELYEQGLKEEGAREAVQRVADLEQQNKVLQNSVVEKNAELAEKDAELAEKNAELAEKDAVITNLKARLGINE